MLKKLTAAAAALVMVLMPAAGSAFGAMAAGIPAAEDSSDFVSDCTSTAGYEYLGTMDKGKEMQKLYDKMYDVALELWNDTERTVGSYYGYNCYSVLMNGDLTAAEASIVYYTFRDDNPIFYFVSEHSACSEKEFLMVVDDDYVSGSARARVQNNIESYVKTVAEKASGRAYDKAKAVHDVLTHDLEYAFESNGTPSAEAWAHNIVGAAEKGKGVCETYARTFQVVLNYLDIDNYFVSGTADGGEHAWNAVRLDDGMCYYIDCTWDDILGDYRYFAKGEQFMSEDHTPHKPSSSYQDFLIELPDISDTDFDPEKYMPAIDSTDYDVNCDGKVNVTDISVVAAHVKNLRPLTGERLQKADLNGDGKINVADVVKLAARVKGIR
ncbi:dockerin type I domain-containing protein [uncultured Ruminococcus sp.]|uniref:dockerin type I domain-containing protein n=1 Tax=uncultured Ruminococcus sp. TaxID=165186 RepID=UPI000ED98C99|nr:dockerin type I domain-containing protein [uncultured Ruminococcus sp.]HCJ41354.1 transglutaminase [Ruminococcus sp.]